MAQLQTSSFAFRRLPEDLECLAFSGVEGSSVTPQKPPHTGISWANVPFLFSLRATILHAVMPD